MFIFSVLEIKIKNLMNGGGGRKNIKEKDIKSIFGKVNEGDQKKHWTN